MTQNQLPPPPPPPPSSSSSSASSFPILAISILGILTTAILLLSYYVFVIKCCLNWRRSDVIQRLSRPHRRHRHSNTLAALYSAAPETRGLAESAIREIPTFRFRRNGGEVIRGSFHECAVCLNEFQEEERIRLLPNCCHVFHIDCIDVWLQTNANCPLCRSEIITTSITTDHFIDQTIDENFQQNGDIVIEVREDIQQDGSMRRTESWKVGRSMGDECIGVRGEDQRLPVQPMRRSFSMDSSSDRLLHLAVLEILQKNPQFKVDIGEGCSTGGGEGSGFSRTRRHFFSFGRGSRSSVTPLEIEM